MEFDADIYLTGSNAFLLSSKLSTHLSGRYVEIKCCLCPSRNGATSARRISDPDLLRTICSYLVDTGLANFLGGYRFSNTGFAFENAVFLQLLYKGYSVHVGKIYQKEVDFIASKDSRTAYLQVTDEMYSESTRERELSPLRSIRDNHEKIVVVRQGTYEKDIDGIRVVRARDFFLET